MTSSTGFRWRSVVTLLLALAVLASLQGTAAAVLGSKYYTMSGQACTYVGTHEHWYYGNSTTDHAGGVTSIQGNDHPTFCNKAQLKMHWKPYGQAWKISTWETTSFAINSGSQFGAQKLGYTDHNVRSTSSGAWYGFKLTHGDA